MEAVEIAPVCVERVGGGAAFGLESSEELADRVHHWSDQQRPRPAGRRRRKRCGVSTEQYINAPNAEARIGAVPRAPEIAAPRSRRGTGGRRRRWPPPATRRRPRSAAPRATARSTPHT